MKKVWKVKNDLDIEFCFEKIGMSNEYMEILLEDDSDFSNYLKTSDWVYICYDDEHDSHHCTLGFGWFEFGYLEEFSSYSNFEYLGEINLRKEKLLRINGHS